MRNLVLVAVVVVIFGCTTSPILSSRYDKFMQGTVYSTKSFPLKKTQNPVTLVEKNNFDGGPGLSKVRRHFNVGIAMAFEKVMIPSKPTIYNIELERVYESATPIPLNMGGKNSLQIRVDDDPIINLSAEGRSAASSKHFKEAGMLAPLNVETVIYRDIPANTFNKILRGKTLMVRIITPSGNIDGYIAAKLRNALNRIGAAGKTQLAE